MNFRNSIKRICKAKGITQKGLAEKLGITDISLNQTLRGEYPQLQTLEKIADALGVNITELFQKNDFTALVDNKGELKKFDSLNELKDYILKL